jgi:hypothetical protein
MLSSSSLSSTGLHFDAAARSSASVKTFPCLSSMHDYAAKVGFAAKRVLFVSNLGAIRIHSITHL